MSAVMTPPPTATAARPCPPATWKWSRADYYRLGECGFFQGKRVQLIRGEIIEMSPIGWPHSRGVTATTAAVQAAFAGVPCWVQAQNPLSLAGGEPEPDVAAIAGRPADYSDHPTTALLVVEVSDATLDYDLTTKAELYAEAGIPEYWVLDLNAGVLRVLRDPRPLPPGGHAYQSMTVHAAADSVAPLAAGGAVVRVADLLP